jgi:hypothetical protein
MLILRVKSPHIEMNEQLLEEKNSMWKWIFFA